MDEILAVVLSLHAAKPANPQAIHNSNGFFDHRIGTLEKIAAEPAYWAHLAINLGHGKTPSIFRLNDICLTYSGRSFDLHLTEYRTNREMTEWWLVPKNPVLDLKKYAESFSRTIDFSEPAKLEATLKTIEGDRLGSFGDKMYGHFVAGYVEAIRILNSNPIEQSIELTGKWLDRGKETVQKTVAERNRIAYELAGRQIIILKSFQRSWEYAMFFLGFAKGAQTAADHYPEQKSPILEIATRAAIMSGLPAHYETARRMVQLTCRPPYINNINAGNAINR